MKEKEVDDKSFEDIQKACLSFKVHQTYEAARNLRDVAEKAFIGKEPKPDPQSSVQDGGEIVKAAKRLSEVAFSHCGPGPKHDKMEAFARAIEAKFSQVQDEQFKQRDKILEWNDKFGAVRNLFRNHESRMTGLEETDSEQSEQILELDQEAEDLKLKVGELEKRLKCKKVVELLQAGQPQPKGGVARCKDEKGVEHDLIPRVSFYKTAGFELVRFKHSDGHALFGEALLGINNRVVTPAKSEARTSNITFLFDLPFPATNPEGGSK